METKDHIIAVLRQTLLEKDKFLTAVGLSSSVPRELLMNWVTIDKFVKAKERL
jgi:hypothetical protein